MLPNSSVTFQVDSADGKSDFTEMRVLFCDFGFTQMTNAAGQVKSIPRGGLLNVTVETDGNASKGLFEWMIDPKMAKNGTITYYRPDGVGILKTVAFKEAICVGYHETFSAQAGSNSTRVQLTISPHVLVMNGIEHQRN